MTSLGIDIGGTSIKAAALRDGTLLWTRRSRAYERPDRGRLIDALREIAASEEDFRFDAVGLCVPGLLDRKTRTITHSANVPGLVGTPLDEILHAGLSQNLPPAALLTDAAAAALDLYASRQISGRLLLVVLGTGVGAAVWDENGPLHVDGDSPGHFGQLDVSLDDTPPLGPDGGAGGLEAYIGAPALRARYGDDFFTKPPTLPPTAPPLRALARAIRIGHAIYRPHHVCLAGGIGNAFAPLLPAIRALVERDLTSIARPGWTLTCGEHDFHAAIGAARHAAHSNTQHHCNTSESKSGESSHNP
jgi:predicted NBD/HSP70 family sugar kinase